MEHDDEVDIRTALKNLEDSYGIEPDPGHNYVDRAYKVYSTLRIIYSNLPPDDRGRIGPMLLQQAGVVLQAAISIEAEKGQTHH